MRTPWNAIHAVKEVAKKNVVPRYNPAHLPKPASLPRRPLPPNVFRPPIGQRQIFLPNFTVSLIRPSPHLPANYASFITPLWFNKLDLKDYLYNLYKLEVVSVRSYVIQSKIRQRSFPGSRKWYRPPSRKKMTAELVKNGVAAAANFEFPPEPEDLSPFGVKKVDDGIHRKKRERDQLLMKQQRDDVDERPPEDLMEVRRKAVKLRREREREVEERGVESKGTGREMEGEGKEEFKVLVRKFSEMRAPRRKAKMVEVG